ncbi:MAG: hypothetical protein QF464_17740 [Myxococcota bacterium]|nr:hypothetical protein [Myxococcota bacterium]
MSALALQRVMVRMLYDPAFADRVFGAPHDALADVALSPEETRWITRTDRRAWRLDPMRRSRTLFALLEEYPASAADTVSADGHTGHLDAFFSSSHFHDAIQTRQALVVAFGAFLLARAQPTLTPLARIEAAITRCRRATTGAHPDQGSVTLAPGCEVLELPAGALDRYTAIVTALDQANRPALETVLAEGFRLSAPATRDESGVEHVLVEPGAAGPRLGEIPEALARLLVAATQPLASDALRQVALSLGAEGHEADELIDELVTDGVLLRG